MRARGRGDGLETVRPWKSPGSEGAVDVAHVVVQQHVRRAGDRTETSDDAQADIVAWHRSILVKEVTALIVEAGAGCDGPAR